MTGLRQAARPVQIREADGIVGAQARGAQLDPSPQINMSFDAFASLGPAALPRRWLTTRERCWR
jgi:hypothetical protein